MTQPLDNLYEIRKRMVDERRELAGHLNDFSFQEESETYGKVYKYNHKWCLDRILELQDQIETIDRMIVDERNL